MALQPRGIRNNNPGNIVWSARNNWQGQLPHDPQIEPRFCRFDTAHNGTRALAKLLLNYRKVYGLRTVESLIARWRRRTRTTPARMPRPWPERWEFRRRPACTWTRPPWSLW